MRVVIRDPAFQHSYQLEGTDPCLEPEACLFQGAHGVLGVGIPLGGVIAGTRVMAPRGPTGSPEGHRGRLAATVTHLALSRRSGGTGR